MSVPKKYEHIDFKPTKAMAEEAQTGLEWRKEYGRGGTDVGVARARDIKNGENLSPDTVKRMHSFFSRHESNKQAEGWNPGEDGYPSAGKIAHKLWGGNPGQTWARARVRQMDAADENSKALSAKGSTMARYKSRSSKAFSIEDSLKAVQSMRKSLIEASRQAMLASDDIESAAFDGNDMSIQSDMSPDLNTAMAACKEIAEHVKAAIEISEDVKAALRGSKTGSMMADDTPYAERQGVRRTSPRVRKSLQARRQAARLRSRI